MKDVERVFVVLQSRFAGFEVQHDFGGNNMLWYILTTCVIMHNVITENERDGIDVGDLTMIKMGVRSCGGRNINATIQM